MSSSVLIVQNLSEYYQGCGITESEAMFFFAAVQDNSIPSMNNLTDFLNENKLGVFDALPPGVKTLLHSQLMNYVANSSIYFSSLGAAAPVRLLFTNSDICRYSLFVYS
jgi:hypothetical protein